MPETEIINTRMKSPFQDLMALESWKSWDYYHCRPYPQHAFGPQKWPLDKGGPPTALPYAQVLIQDGAEFVFRNGDPSFVVPDDPEATKFLLNQVITPNSLSSRWVSLAQNAANHGAIAAKFVIDPNDKAKPVRITFLDVPQECRIWVNPHDADEIWMARIQYPYRIADGSWWYFREEWTAEKWVTYHPLHAADNTCSSILGIPDYGKHLGDVDNWQIAGELENPYGCIPVRIIKNREVKGNPYGVGDCWNAWKLMDRLALTMHGEDKANQLHSEPTGVIVNAKLDNDSPPNPGELISVSSDKRDGPPADFKLVEPSGAAREYSHMTMERWEDLLYKQVGLSRVNPAEVTNKGNMTALAFAMTYGRSISTSDMKRKLWGDAGLCRFFADIIRAAANLKTIEKALNKYDRGVAVNADWPAYFEPTDDDLQVLTDRTNTQIDGDLLTHEKGVQRVARAEKIPEEEIKTMLEELKQNRIAKAAAEAAAQSAPDESASVGSTAASSSAVGV